MKRQWKVQRTLLKHSEGQRRWDIAYQRLLQWTQEVADVPDQDIALIITQEAKDESRHLRPCLDLTTTTKPNH